MMDADVQKPKKTCKRHLQVEDDRIRKKANVNGLSAEEIYTCTKSKLEESNRKKHAIYNEEQEKFNGKSLRTLFSSSSGLETLRKFVTICNENKERDLASEYLLAGGNILEILKLLDSSDRKNITDANVVFSATNILLMRILAQYPQYQNSAAEACRHLLNSYMSIVHSMLSVQSNAKQRRIALKLLAAIASLGGNLSRELLAHLSLQQQIIESLAQHARPTDPQSIRTCFIHFVLAFLVEGNTSVIRALLDKRGLLSSIFPGLLYDSKDIVHLVLTTVRMYVLENTSISKTIKLHVFSTSVVLNLVSLYNWKGPKNWPKNKIHGSIDSEEFNADKEVVNCAVHEFLIILLTSHRYGLIFHDRTLGGSRNKHNQLVHTVLQNLEKPWEHEKPSDLIIKIMGACPDLIRSQYGAIEPFLEPRASPKWIALLRFVKQIIESINSDACIKICSSDLSANNLISALLSLTMPVTIVKNAVVSGLSHENLLVRHEALTLLLTMIQQLKIISLSVKTFYRTQTTQNQVTDFIARTVPSLEMILQAWNRAFEIEGDITTPENPESVQNPELFDHLDVILSTLHGYNYVCPELLDGSTNLEPTILLSRLSDLQHDEKLNSLLVKATQFLLALDSSIFAPREKPFKEALPFLISLICREESRNNECARDAIRTLLNATGLFETCGDQLDIWIEGFSMITDLNEKQELTRWFMSVLKSAIRHADKYINHITQAEEVLTEQMSNLDVKRAKDIINELFDKANETSSPCNKEPFTASSSTLNGQLVDKTVDKSVDIDKVSSESAVKNDHKPISDMGRTRNEQTVDLDVKTAEDLINELFAEVTSKNTDVNSCFKDLSIALSCSDNGRLANVDADKDNRTFNNSFEELREYNFNSGRMQAFTSISPLLWSALQKASEKDNPSVVWSYLSYVIVHVLHHQVIPELLVHMITDSTSLPVYKYLRSWSNNGQPVNLKSKLPSLRLLRKLSAGLLSSLNMDEIFDGTAEVCFEYSEGEITIRHSLSRRDVRALTRMTVFYWAQLAQRGVLQQTQNNNCKIVLVSLLNIVRSMDRESAVAVKETAEYIFTHPILLHYFSPLLAESTRDSMEHTITRTILEICEVVTQLLEKHSGAGIFDVFFAFRNKFLVQLRHAIEKDPRKVCEHDHSIAVALLKVLRLRAEDVTSLLRALAELEKGMFISSDKRDLSMFGRVVPILLDMSCANQSRPVQNDILGDRFVTRLSLHLIHLKSNKINNVGKWEEALARYLSRFPRDIAAITTDVFALLLARGIHKSTVVLIATLIATNTRLIPSLVKYFLKTENAMQGDVVFPILQSNLQYKWNEKFLRVLYERYNDDISRYLTEPRDPVPWIEENPTAVVYLIENTLDLALCKRICDSIAQSGDKLDAVSVCYVRLLESLYSRYEALATSKEIPLTELIKILLHVITLTLKKESKNTEKIGVLCEKLDGAVTRLREDKRNYVFSSLSKSYSWPQFIRFSLKVGLKGTKDDTAQSRILWTLSNLCDVAYGDNTDDEYARTLFEMATSHSEFVNVLLGTSIVKGALVELLWVLTRKDHSVMNVSHVPLYLAAYNATLNGTDQRILRIIQHYEAHGVKIQRYWPYLWGNAAATRYSVKGETDTALWRQPTTSEVFNLFDKDLVNGTIRNYPVNRALKDDGLYDSGNDVYDPAFYLPLLCSLLAENNVVACHKITQSGALALTLAACGSESGDVRMTAYTVISRYYFHLEASRSKEKLLWMRLIDALRNGATSLKCPLKDIRLSCLVSTFLARASLVATQPLHPLYSPLHTFLMAKPALDLTTIPELLRLLHSSHVEHKAHRHWILEIIRDGMKTEGDVDVALKCVLFKMLLDFHTCVLSDVKSKKLILEIVASTTKIPRASLLLVRGYGLLPWLHRSVGRLENCETEVIDIVIGIIENLLNSLDRSTDDTAQYRFLLFGSLLQLKTRFPRGTTNDSIVRYANVIKRIVNAHNMKGCANRPNIPETLGTFLSKNTPR